MRLRSGAAEKLLIVVSVYRSASTCTVFLDWTEASRVAGPIFGVVVLISSFFAKLTCYSASVVCVLLSNIVDLSRIFFGYSATSSGLDIVLTLEFGYFGGPVDRTLPVVKADDKWNIV